MSPRALALLRVLIAVLMVGIVVVGAAITRQLIIGSSGAPRTELERAVMAAEEAVRSNPNDANARIKLAAAYLEQGSAASAIKQAKEALRLSPKEATAFYILGLAESKTGDVDAAIRDLKTASTTKGTSRSGTRRRKPATSRVPAPPSTQPSATVPRTRFSSSRVRSSVNARRSGTPRRSTMPGR